MNRADVSADLEKLAALLEQDATLKSGLAARWSAGGRHLEAAAVGLPAEVRALADTVGAGLAALSMEEDGAVVASFFEGPTAELVLSWCEASAWRRDAALAGVLRRAAQRDGWRERVVDIARARVVEGPFGDALSAGPLLGSGRDLALPINEEARARLQILIWEAGASAREVPALGAWFWGDPAVFETMIREPARGALRGRVLAARALEVAARGLPPTTDPELVGKTLQVLQPLLLHPEPLVWVHAARALGRLTGALEQLEGTLLDWVLGDKPVLRQRAMTAFASLPSERLTFLGSQLLAILQSKDEEPWVLAAVAAATPYLFLERRDLWDRLAARILAGDGGAIAARGLARGLATLWRRGSHTTEIEGPLRALREIARSASPSNIDDARRWGEVVAVTDPIDAAERDPLDIELGLENLVRLAAQYDDENADARAAHFAASLAATFEEARRVALNAKRLRQQGAGMNALEGCARAFALRLWAPLLATRPSGTPIEEPDLEETWQLVARAPAEMLDAVKEARHGAGGQNLDVLEVLAVRLGGYALDACGEDSDLGPGRGPTAHATCLWLRKLEGLADGSRELPGPLKGALSTLFWRLVDTTQGTALGEVDDERWLGPFAAWWALVIDRPAMLVQLATALPMIDLDALKRVCDQAEALRTAIGSGTADGTWGESASQALSALHASDTELAHALSAFSCALGSFAAAAGPKPNLEALCLELVLSADRIQGCLSNPVKALHQASLVLGDDSLQRRETENAPRVAALVARAVRTRDPSALDVWFASFGSVAGGLVERAVQAAIRRTPPPPPSAKKKEPKIVEGYELIKPLGEGGIGTVWLVKKPGAERFFVLKIPKADALESASDTERDGILASFVEEAKALAGLYHPNVANIIDRGVSGTVPFLVLEYLIGADLKQYASARLMTLFELRQVVAETCAGLAALHSAGLVHRDIKPANLWLRLPLQGGERFVGEKHRDPAQAQPLATVVIDFGMVRAIRVPASVGGRFVAGTAGYIAPEQVLDPVELDGRSDVYALAGTIYNVTTGRSFFDEIENPRDRIIAHMKRDPFEDAERLRPYPQAVAKLLRAATAMNPKDRPLPLEFGKAFGEAL